MSTDDPPHQIGWDEAVKILHAAGYHLEHVTADQWRIRLGRMHPEGTVVREATLIALAETMQRVVQRPEWRW